MCVFFSYYSWLTTRGSMGLEFLSLDSSCILIPPSCFKTTQVRFCSALSFFPPKLTESNQVAKQRSKELILSIREVLHPLMVKTFEKIYRNNFNMLHCNHYFQERHTCKCTRNGSLAVITIVFLSMTASLLRPYFHALG